MERLEGRIAKPGKAFNHEASSDPADVSGCGLNSHALAQIGSFEGLEALTIDAGMMTRNGILALRGMARLRYLSVNADLLPGDDGNLPNVRWIRVPVPAGTEEDIPLLPQNVEGVRDAFQALFAANPDLQLSKPPNGRFHDRGLGQHLNRTPLRKAVQGTGAF